MQFSKTIMIAAMAISGVVAVPWASTTAAAAPTPPASPPSSGGSTSCGDGATEVCCDAISGLLGIDCLLSSLLGEGCTQETLCCVNNGVTQSCTDSTGTVITIPIGVTIPITIL